MEQSNKEYSLKINKSDIILRLTQDYGLSQSKAITYLSELILDIKDVKD